jgi:hypothetical protein
VAAVQRPRRGLTLQAGVAGSGTVLFVLSARRAACKHLAGYWYADVTQDGLLCVAHNYGVSRDETRIGTMPSPKVYTK